MLHECLAIVAAVCLNQDSRVEIISNSIWGGARIEVDGATITSIVRTDAPVFPDRRLMSRYCSGGECIHYHVHCASEAARYSCRISYNAPGDNFSKRLEISTVNESQMAGLFGWLRIAGFRSGNLLPLSGLQDRSLAAFPPYCRPREDRGCL